MAETIYLNFNLAEKLDASKSIANIAYALETLAKAQDRMATEQRVANMLRYAELKHKLDAKQINELNETICFDKYVIRSNDEC